MSYGASVLDLYRRSAAYVDKIRKGAQPADLPVERPTGFELVIKRKAAKAIKLTMPPALLTAGHQGHRVSGSFPDLRRHPSPARRYSPYDESSADEQGHVAGPQGALR